MQSLLKPLLTLTLAASILTAPSLVTAQTAASPAPVDVQVGIPPSQDVGPILYALHAGLFAKAGLNVVLQPLTSGAAISAAVAGGTVQIGFSSLQGLISGHARGIPFSLIAAGGVYSPDDPYAYMFVKKDAPYKTAADLDGKTLGSPALKDLDWIANASWMEKNGGDFKSTKSVELPNPALLPALESGRLDAYTVGQPWATIALDSGNVRILAKSFEAIAPRFLMTGWFSTTDYVDKNRSVVDRFNRVLHDATIYANAHKSEIVPLLAAFTKLDPAVVARTMKGAEGEYLEAAQIQPMIDASARYGIIDKSFAADELISPAALKKGN
jgi:ABC-type nitrate/sulfonate/bicarbonate transport system substrate-binding protein